MIGTEFIYFAVKFESNDDFDMTDADNISSSLRVTTKSRRQLNCDELFSSSSAVSSLFLFLNFPSDSCLDI